MTKDEVIADLIDSTERIRLLEKRLLEEREIRDDAVVSLIVLHHLSWRVVAAYAGIANTGIGSILKKRGILG